MNDATAPEPITEDEERAWHDVMGLVARSVESHASALVELRIGAGMDPNEARESVSRYGMRLAAAVTRAANDGALRAFRWHEEGASADG